MDSWCIVALGLVGLLVGGSLIWRALTGGPTKHEHSQAYYGILRALFRDAKRKDK